MLCKEKKQAKSQAGVSCACVIGRDMELDLCVGAGGMNVRERKQDCRVVRKKMSWVIETSHKEEKLLLVESRCSYN